nr:hypothetical protein [Eubacterium sp.]
MQITVVVKDKKELENPTKEYPFKGDKTTFYVCQGHVCKPPTNELGEV